MHPIHLVGFYITRLPVFRWKARGYDWIVVDSIGQPSLCTVISHASTPTPPPFPGVKVSMAVMIASFEFLQRFHGYLHHRDPRGNHSNWVVTFQ